MTEIRVYATEEAPDFVLRHIRYLRLILIGGHPSFVEDRILCVTLLADITDAILAAAITPPGISRAGQVAILGAAALAIFGGPVGMMTAAAGAASVFGSTRAGRRSLILRRPAADRPISSRQPLYELISLEEGSLIARAKFLTGPAFTLVLGALVSGSVEKSATGQRAMELGGAAIDRAAMEVSAMMTEFLRIRDLDGSSHREGDEIVITVQPGPPRRR